MRQRHIWISVGLAVVLCLLLWSIAGVSGFRVFRDNQSQQQQATTSSAPIGTADIAIAPSANPTPVSIGTVDTATTLAIAPTKTPIAPLKTAPAATVSTTSSMPSNAMFPVTPTQVASTQTSQLGALSDIAAGLLPESRGALAQHPNAPFYRIDARFSPDQRTITGQETIGVTNTEDVTLNELYLRLEVNAPQYNEGSITVENVQINDQPVQTRLEVGDTALRITLPQPLAMGRSVEVNLRFTTIIPNSGSGYGIFNEADGVFALYNWHPELDVYENKGWLLDPISAQGDPTNTDSSNYSVTFTAPPDYTIVTSGVEIEHHSADGQIIHRIVSALTRNFVIVASNRYKQLSQQVGAITVNSYYLPGHDGVGRTTLDTAAKAIQVYSKQFGAYGYPELDVTEVKLGGGAAGMESTGLIMIGSAYYQQTVVNRLGGAATPGGAQAADFLTFATAHEVAHQWWYGTVGSDAYKRPWLDESLTNWSASFYVEQTLGTQAGIAARDIFLRNPYQNSLSRGDIRLDQPVDNFNRGEYVTIVYDKGALMYDVLRQQVGDEKFFAFLRRYAQKYQFERVDGHGWLATLAEVIGQQEAATFYQKWVEGNSITSSDLPH